MQTSARSADQFKRTNSNGWTPANHRTSSESTLSNPFQQFSEMKTLANLFSELQWVAQWGIPVGIPQCDQFDNCSRQLQPSKVFKESKEIDKQISRLLQWAPSADCLSGLSQRIVWVSSMRSLQWGPFSEVPSVRSLQQATICNDFQRSPGAS